MFEEVAPAEDSAPESGPYYGDPLLQWEIDEFPRVQRSRLWYVIASAVAVALIIYAVATADFLFAIIILMAGIIMLVSSFSKPNRIEIFVTTLGLAVGDRFYEFKNIRDFSIVYDPPHVKLLYVSFHSPLEPLLSIPLEETDPNDVRDFLGAFCAENLNRTSESLTDRLRRVYKL